jgi:hypothetical protein
MRKGAWCLRELCLREIKSLLYQWAAICFAHLDASPKQIEALFKKAVEIDPENELAKKNYEHFRKSKISRSLKTPPFRVPSASVPRFDTPKVFSAERAAVLQ